MTHLKCFLLLALFLGLSALPSMAQSTFATDRATAQLIQPTGTYIIDALHGAGNTTTELANFACLSKTALETNTHWFRFDATEEALLTFSLSPLHLADDLDFELYQLTDADQLQSLRCSGSGRVLGEAKPNDACLGVLGLHHAATLSAVPQGCSVAEHFLSPAPLHIGKNYLLMVHNYSSATGFTLSFGKLTLQTETETLTAIGEVYPSPAAQDAFLPITLAEATTLDFLLLRANGQVLQHKVLDLPAGAQRLPISMSDEHADEILYIRLLLNGQVVHRKVVR